MRQGISEAFHTSLSPSFVFDAPTIAAMAAVLAAEHEVDNTGERQEVQAQTWEDVGRPISFDTTAAKKAVHLVGLSSRLPSTPGGHLAEAWAVLEEGRDLQGVIPLARWDVDRIYAPPGTTAAQRPTSYARFATLCDGVEAFDAGLLRVSPGEALLVDPQTRLLLEGVHSLLAGSSVLDPRATGVFSGCMYHEYLSVLAAGGSQQLPGPAFVGSGAPYMVGRIAFTFGLRGEWGC